MNNTYSLDLEKDSSQCAYDSSPSSNLAIIGDLTIEMWVKLESFTDTDVLIAKYAANETEEGNICYWLALKGTTELEFVHEYSTGTNETIDSTKMGLTTGIWTHIAVVRDTTNNVIKFYKNGIWIEDIAYTNECTGATSGIFYIGATSGGALAMDGLIDDVRVWDDIRTADEIHDNIFNNVTGQANLQGYWKFDNNANDSSGNGTNLTLYNTPVYSSDAPFPEYRVLNPVPLASTTLAEDENLQGYWRLEDVTDSSANEYDLTNNNTATFAEGKFGNAVDLEFDSGQYLSIADASCPNLEISGSQTWGFWAKPESIHATSAGRVMQKAKLSTATSRFEIYCGAESNPGWTVAVGDGTVVPGAVAQKLAPIGEWSFVVAVLDVDNDLLNLYVNGILVGTTAFTGTHGDSNADFKIGASSFGSADAIHATQYFDGMVDDAFIFNRVLTAQEIFDLYTGKLRVKTINGIALQNIKTINGKSIGNTKTVNGVS